MEIVVDVIHQKMHASITKDIAAGSQRFVKFKFNLDKEWNGLKIFAQFRQGNAAYNDFLDDENCVYLPQEIQAGCCYLMLYGSNDSIIGTVCPLALTINDNKLISNAESIEITESLYNQLITEFMRLEHQVSDFTNNDDIVKRINEAVVKELDKFNLEELCDECLEAVDSANRAAEDAEAVRAEVEAGGFIESLKDQNAGKKFKVWSGTQAEYDAVEEKENNCLYIIEDDTDLQQAIEKVNTDLAYLVGCGTVNPNSLSNLECLFYIQYE